MSVQQLNSQSCQTLADWLCYIEQSHPIDKIELGLDRVRQVAARGDLAQLPGTVVLIAGTNGKGTTARTLEHLLLAQGFTVGVYSSPHLLQFNERLRLNGTDVVDADWLTAFQLVEQLRLDVPLSYFEFTTLVAFAILRAQQPDYCLIEVGLGGRLDATNIVDPAISVITTIDLDHQEYLGNTREIVGREKAGVCRSHCISIVGEPNLPHSVTEYAQQIACQLLRVGHEFEYQLNGDSWSFSTQAQQLTSLTVPSLPLANAACVVALINQIWPQISIADINRGLALATLPGRLECVSQAPLVLLDVAHNPHAAKYLAVQLRQKLAQKANVSAKVIALCGMLKDKDIAGVFAELIAVVDQWNLVTLSTERGATSMQLQHHLLTVEPAQATSENKLNINTFDDIDDAWQSISTTIQPDDVVIVFGSFYTVAAFKSKL